MICIVHESISNESSNNVLRITISFGSTSNDNNNFESQIIKCDTTSSGKYLEIKVSLKNTDKITHDYRGNLMGIDIDKNIIDAQYSYAFDVDPNEIVILSTLLEDSFEIDSCTIQIKVD